ncbi:MAG: hypothetical protein ACRD0C_09725 [Acidimicrobiia bacterium]
MRTVVENRHDRLTLVEDAGWGRISATSVAAGILVGYGAFAILAGLAAAVLGALDVNVDLTGADLRRTGTAGGIVLGVVLFVSWYFGAYTAGRMARRAGATHGVVVFLMGVLVAVSVAAAVEALGGTDDVVAGLERLGVPTTAGQWSDIGTVAGIASLVGMLAGCLLGGSAGERWHAKLMTRAVDPTVGPEAYARAAQQEAMEAQARRQEREICLPGATPTVTPRNTGSAGSTASTRSTDAPAPLVDVAALESDGDDRSTAGARRKKTTAAKARSEEESTAS